MVQSGVDIWSRPGNDELMESTSLFSQYADPVTIRFINMNSQTGAPDASGFFGVLVRI